MAGRGAWPVSGRGGTKQYKDADTPGPYYYLGTGYSDTDTDEHAVRQAVKSYQRRLNAVMGTNLVVDGKFGPATSGVVTKFQQANIAVTGTPWGGIGPETSAALLKPLALPFVTNAVPVEVLTGIPRRETNYDPGAVGATDENDYGLVQINLPSHPGLTVDSALEPTTAFKFVRDYITNARASLNNNLRDAIASYNLGIGGARSWISAGRPDVWSPTPTSKPRNVKAYIDFILKG